MPDICTKPIPMTRLFFFALLLLLATTALEAQPDVRMQVLSAWGGASGTANITLGEAIIFSADSPGGSISQGFQSQSGLPSLPSAAVAPSPEVQALVYPNPATGWAYLETNLELDAVYLHNTLGQVFTVYLQPGGLLDLRPFPPGYYQMSARSGGRKVYIGTLVKSRL